MAGLVVVELFADEQQWQFHQAKQAYHETAKPVPDFSRGELDRGFVSSRLWAWSRHPNFAAEQAFWACLYAWSSVLTQAYLNWTAVGIGAYLVLFQGSTMFTEWISSQKYPDYRLYQARVAKFVPWFWPGTLDDAPEARPGSQSGAARPKKSKKHA